MVVEKRSFSTGVSVVRGFGVSVELGNKGQMKIIQMSFMILAVFFFFILVGLFFLGIQFADINKNAVQLQRDQAISSLKVIANMPEFSYDSSGSMTIDEDKLRIMAGDFGEDYELFWPVASIEVYKIGCREQVAGCREVVECPGVGCNYYKIYDNGQRDVETYSSFVSICKKVKDGGSVYDRCEIGKLVLGVEHREVGGR